MKISRLNLNVHWKLFSIFQQFQPIFFLYVFLVPILCENLSLKSCSEYVNLVFTFFSMKIFSSGQNDTSLCLLLRQFTEVKIFTRRIKISQMSRTESSKTYIFEKFGAGLLIKVEFIYSVRNPRNLGSSAEWIIIMELATNEKINVWKRKITSFHRQRHWRQEDLSSYHTLFFPFSCFILVLFRDWEEEMHYPLFLPFLFKMSAIVNRMILHQFKNFCDSFFFLLKRINGNLFSLCIWSCL